MSENFSQYKGAIARILDSAENVVGTGFLASKKYIFTCTHVIEGALDISWTAQLPSTAIALEFPFHTPRLEPKPKARVIFWKPCLDFFRALEGEDIAVLELLEPLPSAIKPIPFAKAKASWGDDFRVLGFPEGCDWQGDWAKGKILEFQTNGWLQLHAEIAIEEGFSGAPVWDAQKNGVVGMMTVSDLEARKASVISTSVLAKTWKQQGALVSLLNREFESSRTLIQETYKACRPRSWQSEIPTTPAQIVFDLHEMPAGESGYHRLVEFAASLGDASRSLRPRLRKWAKGAFQVGDREFNQLGRRDRYLSDEEQQQTAQSYLFIFIHPDGTSDRYGIEAGVLIDYEDVSQGTHYQKLSVNLKSPLSRSQLIAPEPKLLNGLLKQSAKIRQGKLQIEFFLPFVLLDLAVDRWKREDEYDEPFPMSEEYPMVVRVLERLKYNDDDDPDLKIDEWREKWNRRQQHACCLDALACCDRARAEVAEDLERGCIGLRRKTTQPPVTKKGGMFSTVMKEGIPFALWVRQDLCQCCNAEKYQMLLDIPLEELPLKLKSIRNATPRDNTAHIGHHLSLLWDNPYKVPPDAPSYSNASI